MDLKEEELKFLLAGKPIGDPLYFSPETDSTNTLALDLARAGAPEGAAVVADRQRAGRGRLRSREWYSPAGANIYTSIILRPPLEAALVPPITLTAGVAVAELFSLYCPGKVTLKWPNDVLIGGRKACGILTETRTAGKKLQFAVLGIGINVNMERQDMPAAIETSATSLRIEKGAPLSRLSLIVELYEKIDRFYRMLLKEGFGGISALWYEYSGILGREITVHSGEERVRGTVTGIGETGALLLCGDDGKVRRIMAGDVNF